jgi:ABC-type glycerol-3-phosphate transport system substrate-binding protein
MVTRRMSLTVAVTVVMAALALFVWGCAPTPAPEVATQQVVTQETEQAPAAEKPTAAPGEKKVLTLITQTGPRYQFAAEGMAKEYMKLHPDVEIKVEAFPSEEYVNKLALEVASQGKAFDLIWIDYKFIGGYADAGYLMPIDKYLEANPDYWKDVQEDMYPTILNMYQYKDHWYAIPNDGNTELFYYRKDLLEAAGLEVPQTWDEVLAAAEKLHNPPDVYAICGNFARYWATDFWLSMFFSQGGQIWDENFEPQINSEAAVWSAEMFKKLAEYAPQEALTWEEADVYEAMGSAGICAMAPAQWGGAVLTNPDLASLADQIGVTVPPAIDPERTKLVLPMGGFGLGINAGTAYPDEAWDFLMFYTSRDNQQMLVSFTGQPARISALTDPVNVEMAPYFPALSDSLEYAVPRPVIAEYAKAEQIIGVELDNLLLGNKTTEQALNDANELVRQELVKSGKLTQ